MRKRWAPVAWVASMTVLALGNVTLAFIVHRPSSLLLAGAAAAVAHVEAGQAWRGGPCPLLRVRGFCVTLPLVLVGAGLLALGW